MGKQESLYKMEIPLLSLALLSKMERKLGLEIALEKSCLPFLKLIIIE
jgi:hypothetical protein